MKASTPIKASSITRSQYKLAASAAGQADVEDFLNVRLSASWRVCKNVELFGRIENLLGDQYEEIPGFPALDTGPYAGVKIKF